MPAMTVLGTLLVPQVIPARIHRLPHATLLAGVGDRRHETGSDEKAEHHDQKINGKLIHKFQFGFLSVSRNAPPPSAVQSGGGGSL